MSARASRRDALRRGAVAAAALTAASVVKPLAAAAQSEEEADLRDFLVEAIGYSQIAVLAYANAVSAPGADPKLNETLERFRAQDQAHANAFGQALDSLGFDPPDAPDSAADTAVFDDVEGLDAEAADRLKAELGKLEGVKPPDQIRTLVGAEQAQIDYLAGAAPGLESEDLATTSAEVVGSLSQHIAVLRTSDGEDPAKLAGGFAAASGAQAANPSG